MGGSHCCRSQWEIAGGGRPPANTTTPTTPTAPVALVPPTQSLLLISLCHGQGIPMRGVMCAGCYCGLSYHITTISVGVGSEVLWRWIIGSDECLSRSELVPLILNVWCVQDVTYRGGSARPDSPHMCSSDCHAASQTTPHHPLITDTRLTWPSSSDPLTWLTSDITVRSSHCCSLSWRSNSSSSSPSSLSARLRAELVDHITSTRTPVMTSQYLNIRPLRKFSNKNNILVWVAGPDTDIKCAMHCDTTFSLATGTMVSDNERSVDILQLLILYPANYKLRMSNTGLF